MTIDDMIKSGALIENPTGGTAGPTGGDHGSALSIARALSDEEKACWEAYKEKLQRDIAEVLARK